MVDRSAVTDRHWRRARVIINTSALSDNLNKARSYAPDCQIMAVIKANAYGHGMLVAARALSDVDLFAVAMVDEAYALRADGCSKPIVVLHGFSNADELEQLSRQKIATVVHQSAQLDLLQKHAVSLPLDVWLKLDTGMHRLGIQHEQFEHYFTQLQKCKNVANVFVMSHFANADIIDHPLNNQQLHTFETATDKVNIKRSMANSAAIMRLPQSHFEIVRPGIMLYGSSPFTDVSAEDLGLKAVMQFESTLIDIKTIKSGESIGYGSTYTADRDMSMGVVAVGYGDGYPRHARSGTPVWINQQCCSLLGKVSMDSLCIDLSDVDASIGDRVVLWGKELSVDVVAGCSETIAYELLCNVGLSAFSYQ